MRKWVSRFCKFLALSFSEQLLLAKAFSVVLLIRIALNLFSFSQFKKLYSSLSSSDTNSSSTDACIAQNVWAIQVVSQSLSARCLPQALALKYFLRHDKEAEVVIGVRKAGTFEAHAWVTKENTVLLGALSDTQHQTMDFQPIWTWQ
ncbi:lasso peptide biosynthesis B2 protein [Spirosoma areae]